MSYPDICVSGAGSTEINGTYEYNGMSNGKPSYYKSEDDVYIQWYSTYDPPSWFIFMGAPYYNSSSDTDTPDLASSWGPMN